MEIAAEVWSWVGLGRDGAGALGQLGRCFAAGGDDQLFLAVDDLQVAVEAQLAGLAATRCSPMGNPMTCADGPLQGLGAATMSGLSSLRLPAVLGDLPRCLADRQAFRRAAMMA